MRCTPEPCDYILVVIHCDAATGAAVATDGAPGGAGPYVIGPARPKAATPGNRGPAVARGGPRKAPPGAFRKRPKRLPALHSPGGGDGNRDTAPPEPQTTRPAKR